MLELEVVRVLRAVLGVQGYKVAIFRESVPEELIPRYEKASSSDEQEDLESSDGEHHQDCNDSRFIDSKLLAKGKAWRWVARI
jgi:hypothetical protein